MRSTQYILATIKNVPKNCDVISHQLMLRSGMIRQISAGLYTWLPTGLRVLRKIEKIIREEMNQIGFSEMLMPVTQPSKLWKKSGRWLEYGAELLRFKNRHSQEFVLSPTYEEMISDIICKEIISPKQLPIQVYQIYTKYRDEIRPRFGVIRSKEFIMKDGYSFHTSNISLQDTYNNVYNKYHSIFNRIGLTFCVVQADPGNIGGTLSHEFQAYSNQGEDTIAVPTDITILKNSKNFNKFYPKYNNESTPIKIHTSSPKEVMRLIKVSNNDITISELIKKFNLPINKTIKIIIVQTDNKYKNNHYNFLGLIIRADHELSNMKLSTIPEIKFPITIINTTDIQKIIKMRPTLLNFINLSIPLIIDYNAATINDFIIESNTNNKYFFGVNWYRDLPMPKIADLCISEDNKKNNIKKENILSIHNSIEIGHIFQLEQKYTNNFPNYLQTQNNNNNISITMGCYGIGVTRIIAAIIEQHHDHNGIIWPEEIAPFKLAIIPINMYRSIHVRNITEKLYHQSLSIGIDVLIDDRQENPGVMFSDIDLIGIPHILIISEKNLKNHEIEHKNRKTGLIENIKLDTISYFLKKKLI